MTWEQSPHPKQAPQPRTKPMQVLCLGLSRTGTLSTYIALKQLGLNSYHAVEMARNESNEHLRRWRESIEAKYYSGPYKKLQTAEDFDELLWQYETAADVPCVLFAEELLKAYPDAKVILTERDPDSWLRSVESIFYKIISMRKWQFLEVVDTTFARHYMPILRYALDIWSHSNMCNHDALREGFLEHNRHIKEVVPEEKLLVFHPRDGWEPLCKFLGRPVPEVPFPELNIGTGIVDLHKADWFYGRLIVAAMKALKIGLPISVAALGIWMYQSSQA